MPGMQSVSAALIVRNEEQVIGKCLTSIQNSVDEVVVVDTGSTDSTVSIARKLGARVSSFTWTNDFSAARNYSLELCNTDWVLYIDADERLTGTLHSHLGENLNQAWLAADVMFKPKANYTRYRLTRLFRLDRRIRFEGAIHETIMPSLKAASPAGDLAIGLTNVLIDHAGYDGDLSAKHVRNLPLLESCVRENPNRVFYWFHLTETLLGLGRFEDALDAGFRGIEAAENDGSDKSRVDASMICQMLGAAMLDRGDDAHGLLRKGLKLHPGNFGLNLTLARRELKHGSPQQALDIARALQTVDPESLEPDLIAYDRAIFGRYAIEMEIASLVKLGSLAQAAALMARHASILASGRMPPGNADQS